MIKKLLTILVFLVSTFLILPDKAGATINLDIANEATAKTKIVFNGFDVGQAWNMPEAVDLLSRIEKNLQSTDLFEILKKKADYSLGQTSAIEQVPDFARYALLGVDAILTVDISINNFGKLEIKARLWDMASQKQLFGKYYSSERNNYKKMANVISDEIFKALTGEKNGPFDSKITYIAESGDELHRLKRVTMMDFNGENRRYLTNGRELVLTPIFTKKPYEIIFLRYSANKPHLYSLDIRNNFLTKIGNFRETTFAPSVHPYNQDLLLLSVTEKGSSNIYEINTLTNRTTKLTDNQAINTTPSYSPDGRYITFISDQGGSQQIYVMNLSGSNIKRVSKGFGTYSKPVWSPDGKMIAFTKIVGNHFEVGIMPWEGGSEKILTSAYLVEGAKWGPTNRYLIYSKKNGPYGKASIPKLYIIDIVTGFERELPTSKSEGASDPDWVKN